MLRARKGHCGTLTGSQYERHLPRWFGIGYEHCHTREDNDEGEHQSYRHQPCRQPAASGRADRGEPALEAGEAFDEQAFRQTLRDAVTEVVRRQHDLGIDIPGDGEFGKPMGQSVNYGRRGDIPGSASAASNQANPILYEMAPRRSCSPRRGGAHQLRRSPGPHPVRHGVRRSRSPVSPPGRGPPAPVCVAPITYTGHDAIKADIAKVKEAMQAAGVEEGFMSSVAPASASRIGNTYYKAEEEFCTLRRCDARGVKAIVDAPH